MAAAAIELRGDFSGDDLRRPARQPGREAGRRLPSLAAIRDGDTRTRAAWIGGLGLQIVRDWVLRFNAEGPEGLIGRKAPGKAPTLSAEQRAALVRWRMGLSPGAIWDRNRRVVDLLFPGAPRWAMPGV